MKTSGTIIGRHALTESSLILHWCTRDHGILKTVAKGARNQKSPFAGKIDSFFRCELEVHPSKKSDLHHLKELALLDSRLGIRKSYLRTLGAGYFAKLVERSAEPESPIPELDDLLSRALNFLDQNETTPKAVHHFENELTKLLGISDHGQSAAHRLLADFFVNGLPKQREELFNRLEG